MAFGNVLIHNCTIYRKYESVVTPPDENGQPQYSDIPKSYKCRFFKKDKFRQSGTQYSQGVKHVVTPLSVMLPANVDIQDSDKLTTTNEGYAGTYSVFDIDPIYGRTSIHHYVAKLVMVT
jgi:hypothetical protein